MASEFILLAYEIEAIKQKAKDYIPEPVSENDIVIMETNRGTMKLKLFHLHLNLELHLSNQKH